MTATKNPSAYPPVSQETMRQAVFLNLQSVGVKIVGDDGEAERITVLTPYLPRSGERIKLRDGRMCEVETVVHEIRRPISGEETPVMVAFVTARVV